MAAARAWTTVGGQNPNGDTRFINGEGASRTVYFDPEFARVEVDTSVTPPRVMVTAGPGSRGPSASTSPIPDTIALRDGSADIYARYFNGNCRIGGSNPGGRFVVVSESTVSLFAVSYAGGEVSMGFFGQNESTVPIVDISAISDYASLRTSFLQLVNELSRIGLVQIID